MASLYLLTWEEIFPEEYPRGSDEWSESEEEANEEPDPRSLVSQAAGCVGLAPELAIGHGVDPDNRNNLDNLNLRGVHCIVYLRRILCSMTSKLTWP